MTAAAIEAPVSGAIPARTHHASGITTSGVRRSAASWSVNPAGGPTDAFSVGGTRRKSARASA
jgi:hypothetical protein